MTRGKFSFKSGWSILSVLIQATTPSRGLKIEIVVLNVNEVAYLINNPNKYFSVR